jgi:hypothetical protein
MGLGPSQDTPQDRESRKLVAESLAKGLLDAQRPYCMFETHLSGEPAASLAA